MKFATLPDGTPDGRVHVVSRDLTRAARLAGVATLQALLEAWDALAPEAKALYERLNAGEGHAFDASLAMAPLPRAWQWLDGSAFPMHGRLMERAFGLDPKDNGGKPLMYQGMSHRFLGPTEDVPLPSEADDIDFEGEFGVVTDAVPMGTSPEAARGHIRLLVLINDWSLRKLTLSEVKTGFGWIQAKPACSMAPVAITPDELGAAWQDAQIALPLDIHWNGERFGAARGDEMSFDFGDLVAHGAGTRDLPAGTIVGSGTVSNARYAEVGSSCITERRCIEMIADGKPSTGYLRFGDRITMSTSMPDGTPVFGAIDQKVVRAA
ncbi:MAG: fumarylacetoacetate hydrolase family protein [Pseudomonadota bacterium]